MWPGLGPRWAGREHTAEGSWCQRPSALLAALGGVGSPSWYLSRGPPRSRMPWFAQGFESTGNGPGGQPEPRPPGDPGASPQGRQVGAWATGPQLFSAGWAPHPTPLPGKTEAQRCLQGGGAGVPRGGPTVGWGHSLKPSPTWKPPLHPGPDPSGGSAGLTCRERPTPSLNWQELWVPEKMDHGRCWKTLPSTQQGPEWAQLGAPAPQPGAGLSPW